ncbi:MAG: ABC transporter substrate-binding protein [Opitutales bacterium]|jgi:branched-chain amino acid transport system substrate-binding protein
MPALRVLGQATLAAFLLGLLLWAQGCSTEPELPKGNSRTFVVGAVLPLSGPNAVQGRSMQRGLQLGVADVNAAGGINGHPVVLGIVDTQGDLTNGAVALEKWRDLDVPVILIGDTDLVTYRAENVADYPQLIGFLSDYVAAVSLAPKNSFRVYLNGDQEGRLIEGYLAAAGVNKTAILYASGLIGQSNAKYMEFLIHGDYITTYKDAYTPTEVDYTMLATAMGRLDADSMVLVGYGPEYANILTAFSLTKWTGLVLGYLGQGSLEGLGNQTGLAANLLYPVPAYVVNPLSNSVQQTFAQKFRAAYGKDPDLFAAYAYDNIRVIAASAARSASLQPDKIREGFLALKSYPGIAGTYTIMPDGDTEMPLQLVNGNGQTAPPPPKLPPPSTTLTHITAPANGLGPSLTEIYFKSLPAPAPANTTTSGNTTTAPAGNTTAPASPTTSP